MNESTRSDFYDRQVESHNPIRRAWHRGRRDMISGLVKIYYHGGRIADFGCGNCTWNYQRHYQVIGVDSNFEALLYAKREGRIVYGDCYNVIKTGLPDSSVGLIVTSEVMEHVEDTNAFLSEIKRVLDNKGYLIITVPYDTAFSLWKPLFALQCLWHGGIRGDGYYKQHCGHIHHFNRINIVESLYDNGFDVIELSVYWGMTLCCVAQKEIGR